ncbi:MAG TPA: energy-coupling factor ABC transporter permease [Noviherbaspirillum sp.]|uniref:energy-coupling factor ABC transporter permease n=1 Tax=Noviherbaspirillum sp. TaxID=1926288 RepID=UPI002B47BE04|nr:energy-coupling factor ABC transporter permease [Noviherbaspirillum sp.]HJV86430.1 energy-coupling factor ABC transporter permease [Noviherbaspirillum sp.]
MGIFDVSLPPVVAYVMLAASIAALARDAMHTQWKQIDRLGAFSAWCFSVIVLPLLWRMDVRIGNEIDLHLLGMPLFVLMFGRPLATVGLSLAVIAHTALQGGLWSNLGLNLLVLAVFPAWCGDAVMRATRRFLPHHIFIYLLGNGFFGTMAMLAATDVVTIAAHQIWVAPVAADTIAYMLLLAWGESFLTGFLLTIFTVYRPEWVLTFDDDVYLRGK